MALIANLDVVMRGQTGPLDAALSRTGQNLARFRNRVDQTGAQVSGAFARMGTLAGSGFSALAAAAVRANAALIAVVTAALSVREVFQQMDAIDKIAKSADRLGITTEALVALQHGADLSGVAVETLDSSLTKFAKNLSDAAAGGGEAIQTFQALGLSAQALNAMPLDQALAQLADRLNGVDNRADRLRYTLELFGKGGAGMVNLLAEGSEGMRVFREEAERLGLTLSRDQAASVEAANDAWTRFKAALAGFGRTVGIALAPLLEFGSQILTDLAAAISGFIRSGLPLFVQFARVVIAFSKSLIEFGEMIRGVFFSIIRSVLGEFGIDWSATFQSVMDVLVQSEFIFIHWKDILGLAFDQGYLKIVNWVNDVKHLFTEVLPATFNAFGEALTEFLSNPAGGFAIDFSAITAAAEREWTDWETRMDESIRDRQRRLLKDYDAFLANRIRERNRERPPSPNAAVGQTNNAAVERGTVQAFEIIARAGGDKVYQTLNAQLQENREQRRLLQRLVDLYRGGEAVGAAAL